MVDSLRQQTFRPPNTARETARLGLLRCRDRSAFDKTFARSLVDGQAVSLDTIRKMKERLDTVRPNRSGTGRTTSRSDTEWMLLGGEAGWQWADSVLRQNTVTKQDDHMPPEKTLEIDVAKVDDDLGVVFGYAMVCQDNGEDYYDTEDDHIPENVMLKSTFVYMSGRRIAKDSHRGDPIGQVVFGFPLTADIAKALDIEIQRTGFVIGMRPRSDVMEKFRNGSYTGFSIGGRGERTML